MPVVSAVFAPCFSAASKTILAVNLVGFTITAVTQTHKITDLCGVGAFAAGALSSRLASSASVGALSLSSPSTLATSLVAVWSARLSGYLFRRVCVVGEDKRLRQFFPEDENEPMFTGPSKFPINLAGFWSIQATWAAVVGAPAYLLAAVPSAALTMPTTISFGIAAAGLVLETVADYQKSKWYAQKNRKGYCETGVWKMSRHPNYVGEVMFWSGMAAAALSPLMAANAPAWSLGICLASPMLTYTLVRHVSGVPMLEDSLTKKFNGDADFQQYLRDVPIFWPTPASIQRALV